MKSLPLAITALLLAACTIRGPSVALRPIEVRPLEIEVEDGHRHHHHDDERRDYRDDRDYRDGYGGDGYFCPPGQAKKGNCR